MIPPYFVQANTKTLVNQMMESESSVLPNHPSPSFHGPGSWC
uniref:Uncharacterized protein n=1 Tax=Rhizophora mucronata TaxID=61149 RepID=A0A2P2NG17_RHIMU